VVTDAEAAGCPTQLDRRRHGGRWARVRSHAATPLYGQGYALVLNSMITALLGVPYWLLAARHYSASSVGRNAAAISAMMFLAGVAQLNLMSALLRFIPVSGRRSIRLVTWSYLIAVSIAAGVSAVFLVGTDRWAPALRFLSSSPGFAVWFAAATMAWCVFNLQDSVLTAVQRAALVPVENAAASLAKIVLLVALVETSPRYGIFASWTAALVVSVIPVNILLFGRLLRRHDRDDAGELFPPTRRELVRYISADSVASLFWLAATTLMPVIVIAQVGAAANGYFSLAWMIALPLYAIGASTGASLVVAAAADEHHLTAYARKTTLQTLCLVLPPAAILAIAPGPVLGVFGDAYADHASATLRLLALSAIPNVLTALYVSSLRVQRRMLNVVGVLGGLCGLVVALSLVLLPTNGIAGVGLAWLISQLTMVTLLLILDRRLFWPWTETRVRGHGPLDLAWAVFAADRGPSRVLRRVYRWWPNRRRERRAAQLAPAILGQVVAADGLQAAAGWSLQWCVQSVTDRTVAAVGPPGGAPQAIIKLATTPAAAAGLGREREALATLRADPRLGAWRRILPTVLADGEASGYPYAVESFCTGAVASGLLADASRTAAFQQAAASQIGVLHAATAEPVTIDASLLGRWVERPIFELRRFRPQPWRSRALDRISGELHLAFAGRTLPMGWIHGDFGPSNVLLTPDGGGVAAIVDWELAVSPDLPLVDVVTLLLATRTQAQHRELGDVVRTLLADTRFSDLESGLLDTAQPGLADDAQELLATVLLCWLRHVAANLTKSVRYSHHRIWIRNNVDVVLEAFQAP
jgi:O-antigen/teichoic acid export membrane protein